MRTKERKELKKKIQSGEFGFGFCNMPVQRRSFTYVEATVALTLPDNTTNLYQAAEFSKCCPTDEYDAERGIDIALNRALDEILDQYERDVESCLPF